jgi:hypothetical protein
MFSENLTKVFAIIILSQEEQRIYSKYYYRVFPEKQ